MFNHRDWKRLEKEEKEQKEQSTENTLLPPTPKSSNANNAEDFSTHLMETVQENIKNITKMMNNANDLVTRTFKFGETDIEGGVVFIDGLVDKEAISKNVIEKLLLFENKKYLTGNALVDEIKEEVVISESLVELKTLDDVMLAILSGDTALFIDGVCSVIIFSTKGWEHRAVAEPATETLVRGPREGFIEDLRTNTMLLRRHIRDPNLRFESLKVGRRSKKSIIITYVDGIVNQKIVDEVRRRIDSIDIDDAPESGIIEQWIQDSFLSPFPQLQNTERPDKVSASLLQGRVAILLDGTPFALIAPVTLGQLFHSPEDYYERWLMGTFIRVIRWIAAFIAMFLPALYIALVSYHPAMIPSNLAFSITATREGVPVPAFAEALLMEMTMELLREAGIRLPRAIGQTIGIVGGLVIGEAAVSAGIVSPIMVIVVALTAIASFSIPSYSVAISFRMMRFGLMLCAATFGLYGIIIGYIMINIHIANLKSFGIPFSTPFAPMFLDDWKDMVLRAPNSLFKRRPIMLQTEDVRRVNEEGDHSNE